MSSQPTRIPTPVNERRHTARLRRLADCSPRAVELALRNSKSTDTSTMLNVSTMPLHQPSPGFYGSDMRMHQRRASRYIDATNTA